MRIFSVGETTYDILFRDGHPVSSCSGGSAFNSAVSLGRCGLPVSLISTFGDDYVGDYSFSFLRENNVNCDLVKRFEGQSRIALAFFDDLNNATYSFYQASKNVVPEYPRPIQNDIVLLGSSFALRENGREQLVEFLLNVKRANGLVIYDPNTRQPLQNRPDLVDRIRENFELADIIKGSDQDFDHIFGLQDATAVFNQTSFNENKSLIYTKGAEGVSLLSGKIRCSLEARKVNVVSTIGAGDNFTAGLVYGLYKLFKSQNRILPLDKCEWVEILNSGTYFASEVCRSNENYLPVSSLAFIAS